MITVRVDKRLRTVCDAGGHMKTLCVPPYVPVFTESTKGNCRLDRLQLLP